MLTVSRLTHLSATCKTITEHSFIIFLISTSAWSFGISRRVCWIFVIVYHLFLCPFHSLNTTVCWLQMVFPNLCFMMFSKCWGKDQRMSVINKCAGKMAKKNITLQNQWNEKQVIMMIKRKIPLLKIIINKVNFISYPLNLCSAKTQSKIFFLNALFSWELTHTRTHSRRISK